MEIVLDRPMPAGQTTTFTFDDGVAVNVVEFTLPADTDSDGIADEGDNCPNHANVDQADCDQDGFGDVCTLAEWSGDLACGDCDGNDLPDGCQLDTDDDGLIDLCDGCPTDGGKIEPGVCGCGAPDSDADQDTVADCLDQCPGENDLLDDNANDRPDCLELGPVPTVTGWGLLILALTFLAVARALSVSRRQRTFC